MKALIPPCFRLGFCLLCLGLAVPALAYDPLAVSPDLKLNFQDVSLEYGPDKRVLPLRIYLPSQAGARPVILYSHGLGGSRENGQYLARQLSARGYVCVFMQHPGSDESVWKGKDPAEAYKDLKGAAKVSEYLVRAKDVKAVLNALETWNKSSANPLFGRLDLARVGMSGHSFGALTTQAVSGQDLPLYGTSLSDARIKAALLMSPGSPKARKSPQEAFAKVKIPWMIMTGTDDVSPIGKTGAKDRLEVFANLPPGAKYELVLAGAEHSAFGERALPGDKNARNPNHHKLILALSTAFFDAYLSGDAQAKSWLDGGGPRQMLEPGDGWQRK